MTAVSKNVYIDKLDDIVNEYNNTYHRKIKMKPIEFKDNNYIDYIKKANHKDISAKEYTSNWSEEVFVIKEVKILFYGHMLLIISVFKKLLEHFMKKNYKKQIKKDFG